ncbi:MAG: TetR/AcrR family transcriptional regulator [Pseudooceanicola sp.]|nr:TetR/AcrR family transcriptional regulator [Pseudooceanicola sp.]
MTDQGPDRKAQILTAAARLVSTRGVQALSFENVAGEAGLSRQLVRYYYADLDSLIVDLCDHLAATYRDILLAGIPQVGKVGRLDFFLDFFFDLAEGHPMPGNLEAYDTLIAWSVGNPKLRGRMCDQYRTLGHVVVHELAIAHPQLDMAACEELSFLFVSAMHAHWSFVASLGYSREHGKLARRAIDRLIRSYLDEAPVERAMEKPWAREA